MVKQTGFLFKLEPTDFITGASPLVIPDILPSGDWRDYKPEGEKQYKNASFDTFSCTSFSALNVIETSVNWHRANNNFSQKQIETLNTLGFYADGKFNCSDRFTAIMSGTMPNGNYFQNVLDSIRRDGILSDILFPFGGNSWAEYQNKTLITEEMKDKAKKILDILDISYEWSSTETISNDLKKCPIQGAIPFEASHAIEIIAPGFYFDSYEPYVKPLPVVRYAMKIIVKVKKEMPTYKYFKASEVIGLKPEFVAKLDEARGIAGIPMKITSGYRTEAHNLEVGGVEGSSHTSGLAVDILVKDGVSGGKILLALAQVGFKRFGFYKDGHIHVDMDNSKPSPCYWVK